MAIRLKPKSFGPLFLQRQRPGSFTFRTDEHYLAHTGAPGSVEQATPADLIMASLASCIGISLEMVAEKLRVDTGTIEVEVTAKKATDLPSRFGSFAATVRLEHIDDEELAARLVRQAKEICTVSNTLNADIDLTVEKS